MKKRIFNKDIAAITFMVLFVVAMLVTLAKDRKDWELERLSISHVAEQISFEAE